MTTRPDPVQPADAEARTLALSLLQGASHAALAYADPATAAPMISRIAFGLGPDGGPITLISALAAHFAGLRANPLCSMMLGEVGDRGDFRGDPLTHPRLMVQARAEFVAADDPARTAMRDQWLAAHPKAKLYVDFADFAFVRLVPQIALLNAGFGKAFRLTAEDLRLP